MRTHILTLLSASVLITACSNEPTQQQNTASSPSESTQISCAFDDLNAQLDQTLQQQIKQSINQNNHQLIDKTKLAELVSQFRINTSNITENNNTCSAQLSINIGNEILHLASQNAPLLKTGNPVDLITRSLNNSNIRFDGQNFVLPITYTVTNNTITISDNNFNQTSNLIAQAVLPAGVKDMISVNGREISREAALNQLLQPKPVPKLEETAQNDETTSADETWEDDTPTQPKPKKEVDTDSSNPNKPEILKPEPALNVISDSELDNARQANRTANYNIKYAWQKIPPDIQQSLTEDQRAWESNKRQSCRSVATKGKSSNERQYLQTQCDTRMTKERVEYLNGYSIE
ncbi:MAG: DUF1311 domain-containing protein [Neisseriaceae bacterium]|nr:DUF1311 domain-containing protein [Neisseriaceae bacterium]